MALTLMGRKVGMTQWFDGEGRAVAATVLLVEPSVVVQVKRPEVDGYCAIQLGWGHVRPKLISKPLRGHFAKAGVEPRRRLYEARISDPDAYQVGQTLGVEVFSEGELVDVTGTSKGKGFTGTIKRWGFSYRPKSHGHKLIRRPGTAGPMGLRKVIKGKKMPGHAGAQTVTIRNLRVLKVDGERGLLVVQGSVPGPRKGIVKIRKHDA
ncbi:MAG TPA: 50S ribosomal protein L3 [Candidatus Acetothermia bacterium]|nr:50S ribosomal protein L3 [Candidatus Acetothermia bacterium]